MSKIDANVAISIADAVRPVQIAHERTQQAQQAQQVLVGQAQGGDAGPVGAEDARAALAGLKQVVETASGRKLKFDVDTDSGELFVTISDQATGEVIQQIPTVEALRLHERLGKDLGVLLDRLA